MRIFALSDFHLSSSGDKPMDKFGPHWTNHAQQIKDICSKLISQDDLFLIPGDHSWGLRLEDAIDDLKFIESLPGHKILCRGNHDYWWQGITKIRQSFPGLTFLQNDAVTLPQGISICGTRGWTLPGTPGFQKGKDEKYLDREVTRLKLALDALDPQARLRIVLMHYPPLLSNKLYTPFSQAMTEARVDLCVYGHVHLSKWGTVEVPVFDGRHHGVCYHMVACDVLNFTPWEWVSKKAEPHPTTC